MRNYSTLLHRLSLWARDQPLQPALYYKEDGQGWASISAEQYWKQVVRLAISLRDFGVKRGDRVILYAQNSPEWVQWEMAIWLSGGISVGIHPHTPDFDLSQIMLQVSASLVLVESESYRDRILAVNPDDSKVVTFSGALQKILGIQSYTFEDLEKQGNLLLSLLKPGETQMVIYTSGTTGTPKGVMIGLSQLTFVAEVLSREWKLPYMDGQLFSFLPLAHIAEKVQTLAVSILQRYPVWFNSSYERFFPELQEVRPSLLLAVPRVWERFKEQVESQKPRLLQRLMELEKLGRFTEKLYLGQVRQQLGLDRLKFAVAGAAKLPPVIGEWFLGIGIEIQEIYGMSESSGLITMTHPPREDWFTVGTVPVGVEIKIAADGEILVKGPNVFNGYFGDEAGTREVLMEGGWLKTGDLGEWKNGLHILGRNREIIKLSNGKMVAPLPIENVLKEIPEVSNVCVVGEGRSSLLALITLKEQVLVDLRFTPGAIEGLTVEDAGVKKRIESRIQDDIASGKLPESLRKIVILSRDFSIDYQELTQTQKLNRNQIQRVFRHFIELQFEG